MEVNPDDLKFPMAVISRIIKEALPDGVTTTKETKNAIGRSAAIFILHATSLANDNAQSKKRKNVTAEDILYAVRQLECDELEAPINEALATFNQKKTQQQQHRKERKAERIAEKVAEQSGKEKRPEHEEEEGRQEEGEEEGHDDDNEEEEEQTDGENEEGHDQQMETEH